MDGRLDVAQQTDRPIPEPRTRRVIGSSTSTVGKGEPLRKATLKRVVELFSWLLVLLPVVVGFLYVRAFGVNVVYIDAWSMPLLFDKWASGTLSLWDLYYQHNEHRMFFPKGV
jgi:hypothetical protein